MYLLVFRWPGESYRSTRAEPHITQALCDVAPSWRWPCALQLHPLSYKKDDPSRGTAAREEPSLLGLPWESASAELQLRCLGRGSATAEPEGTWEVQGDRAGAVLPQAQGPAHGALCGLHSNLQRGALAPGRQSQTGVQLALGSSAQLRGTREWAQD